MTTKKYLEPLLTIGLSGVLAVSLTTKTLGSESMSNPSAMRMSATAGERLPLPPIPYLDTMPWLGGKPSPTLKIDTLFNPRATWNWAAVLHADRSRSSNWDQPSAGAALSSRHSGRTS